MTKKKFPKLRTTHPAVPPYRHPELPAVRRVKDLLARMTLEEKATQMVCVWQQKQAHEVRVRGTHQAFTPAVDIVWASHPAVREVSRISEGFRGGPAVCSANSLGVAFFSGGRVHDGPGNLSAVPGGESFLWFSAFASATEAKIPCNSPGESGES